MSPHEIAAIRLGYGLSPRMGQPDDPGLLPDSVARSQAPDGWTTGMAADAQNRLAESRKQRASGAISDAEYKQVGATLNDLRLSTLRRRVARALDARAGLGERLVQFWAGHFATNARNPASHVLSAAMVDEAIRPHLSGRFADMMAAADTHPMMITYLSQVGSVGPNSVLSRRRPDRSLGLNENLAREAMELHSLGVGAAYEQADVRELAELLTGLTYSSRGPRRYRAEAAEPGADIVLGESYGGPGTSGLDEIRRAFADLADWPETAAHLARKLAIHFVADDPPADLVAALQAVWQDSGGDLAQVNAVLASHPAVAAGFRQKARQPFDFLVAALRSLGVDGATILGLDARQTSQILWGPLVQMGQPWAQPRGPDGWPEPAESWITPQLLSARIGWALRLPARLVDPLPDPRAFVDQALGTTASEPLRRAVPRAESLREGVAIVLASSDFNRR